MSHLKETGKLPFSLVTSYSYDINTVGLRENCKVKIYSMVKSDFSDRSRLQADISLGALNHCGLPIGLNQRASASSKN